MHFASDNAAGIAAPILNALTRANEGFAFGYGNDDVTERLNRRFAEVFEREVAAFLVPSGTAANALALAHLAPPWGAVICHEGCHLATDECGASEFFGGGLKLVGLKGPGGKVTASAVEARLSHGSWGGPHHVVPAVLSVTQPTEAGTIYGLDELRELAGIAQRRGLAVHMDGARLANALARMNITPAEATWRSGVDVLSLGATKGGALAAEAVIFFDPSRAAGMSERRKRGGHLVSKHRFLAAQFEAFLTDDLWLSLAAHANTMADILSARLRAAGLRIVWPVEANEVFVVVSHRLDRRLRAAGACYYVWSTQSQPDDYTLGEDELLARLVTSFATSESEIKRFAAIASAQESSTVWGGTLSLPKVSSDAG